jgi:hypothetical protein
MHTHVGMEALFFSSVLHERTCQLHHLAACLAVEHSLLDCCVCSRTPPVVGLLHE